MVRRSLWKLASRTLSVAGRWQRQQLRGFDIHEHQLRNTTGNYGINVPWAVAARCVEEVKDGLKNPSISEIVVGKDQNLSDGRGLGLGAFNFGLKGGVHTIKANEAESNRSMLGQILVTKQPGPEGNIKIKIHLCEKPPLTNEMYFVITPDWKTAGPLIIACSKQGTSIEDLAEKYPDMTIKPPVGISKEITSEEAAKDVDGVVWQPSTEQIKLHEFFCKCDCTLLEALDDIAEQQLNKIRCGFKGQPDWCGEIGEDGLPTWVDWTMRGAVTPVQNQLIPGPCWAFTSIGAIEVANFLHTGKLIKLSEQQLLDCNNVNNYGFEGGLLYEAFQYVLRNGGVASDEVYPYVGKQHICKPFETDLYTISGIGIVTPDCEHDLKKAVSRTAVGSALHYSEKLKYYTGGVLYGPNSKVHELEHSVLLVGYNNIGGQDVWKVKNSEGGEHGYIYIARNVYEAGGTLGIARYCIYPKKNCPNRFGLVRSEVDMGIKPAKSRSIDSFYYGLLKPE